MCTGKTSRLAIGMRSEHKNYRKLHQTTLKACRKRRTRARRLSFRSKSISGSTTASPTSDFTDEAAHERNNHSRHAYVSDLGREAAFDLR